MQRLNLKRHGVLSIVPEINRPLDLLIRKVQELKEVKLGFVKIPQNSLKEPFHSMFETGREVGIKLTSDKLSPQESLSLLWNLVIPLGFTPLSRYPIPGEDQHVFHYLGPWNLLYERLLAEGRGAIAWSSVCIASKCDVGAWKGDRVTERSVQSQLHRTGINCGPIDGVIGKRTSIALKSANLTGISLSEAEKELLKRPTGVLKTKKDAHGHLVMQGVKFKVSSFGRITTSIANNGAAFSIQGPGRIIIDVE